MNDTSTSATLTSFKDVYRVNIQDGKNLPVDLLPKVPAGRYCLRTAQAGWGNMPNLSQREAFTVVDGHPVTSHLLLFIWTRNQTYVDY